MSDMPLNAVSLDNFDQLALYWASVFGASSTSPSVRVGCCPPHALSLEAVLAADAALGPLPFVSFASIYKEQLHMKRELDIMCEQVDDMQVKLDAMTIEIAAHKKRRR